MKEEPASIIFGPHFASQSDPSLASVALLGGKAAGLAGLPLEWVPPYVVVSTELFRRWHNTLLNGSTELAKGELLNVIPLLKRTCEDFKNTADRVFVRSSAANETLRDRGRYESAIAECDVESVVNRIHSLWIRYIDDGPMHDHVSPLALLLQPFVQPQLAGHLSNERRVSRHAKSWLIEFDAGTGLGEPHRRICIRTPNTMAR